jgi:transcriptional regulator with XRE-family HTH domain
MNTDMPPLKKAIRATWPSQNALAARIGCDPSWLSSIVHGRRPSPTLAKKIAKALGRDVKELF